MSRKIYVASSFLNKDLASRLMGDLREAGHSITHDWTTESTNGMAPIERAVYLEECAREDLQGVLDCDTLVLIDHPKARGAYTEFGAALALGKRIFVLLAEAEPNIFLRLPQVMHLANFDDLLKVL